MSSSSYSLMQSCSGLSFGPGHKSKNLPFNPIGDVSFSRTKLINSTCVACNISLKGFGTSLRAPKSSKTMRKFVVYSSVEGGNPLPSGAPSGSWKNWVVGIVISFILPLFTNKLGPIGLLKHKFDTALQSVENIVETVEKVAGGVEKVAEDLLDDLPDGQLKKVVSVIEHAAERAAKDADKLDDFIDELQEQEEKMEDCVEAALEKADEKTDDVKEAKDDQK